MSDAVYTLPDALDGKAAAGLRLALLERRGAGLALDGANVERLGGLCVQVLLAGAETWASDKKSFGVVNPSDAMVANLARMGASELVMWRSREGET